MTVIELSFPTGRYHATPWGRHVNEGAIEWPPSPWRIVRALIATWYLKAHSEIPAATVHALADALSQPPVFRLPRATTAHTRHYMPYNEGKNEKTTKVFDTFVQLPERASVLVGWDVVLSVEQLAALQTLAGRLGYFGRAESIVEARLLEGVTAIEPNATPLSDGTPLPPQTELIPILAPMTAQAYTAWRRDFLAANATQTNGKKRHKKSTPPSVPDDLFAALHAYTGELQPAGWNLPPGARYIIYTRPENPFAPASKPCLRLSKSPPTVARYAVVSTVAPSITRAVSVADRVHDALCKWSDDGTGAVSVFRGTGDAGKPLKGHNHAHIFCEANGARDAITHLTVWSPHGFDEQSCLALRRLNKVWGHGGQDLRLVLIALGQPQTFPDCRLFGCSNVWRSATPFVPTRHPKTFRDGRPKIDPKTGWQTGSAGHDLLRLMEMNHKNTQVSIRQEKFVTVSGERSARALRCLQFQTVRHNGGGSRGHGAGASFTITFPEKVTGPLSLGYGAHFGLGLFVPVPVPGDETRPVT